MPSVDACARWAVAEGVVDVHVAKGRRAPLRTRARSPPPPRWKRRFSSSTPRLAEARWTASSVDPDAVVGNGTSRPSSSPSRWRSGAGAARRGPCPSGGRDGSRGRAARRGRAALRIVGRAARMRVSSAISPSCHRDVEVDADEDALAARRRSRGSVGLFMSSPGSRATLGPGEDGQSAPPRGSRGRRRGSCSPTRCRTRR